MWIRSFCDGAGTIGTIHKKERKIPWLSVYYWQELFRLATRAIRLCWGRRRRRQADSPRLFDQLLAAATAAAAATCSTRVVFTFRICDGRVGPDVGIRFSHIVNGHRNGRTYARTRTDSDTRDHRLVLLYFAKDFFTYYILTNNIIYISNFF